MLEKKTSGLVDIGLITSNRELTPAGDELLRITDSGRFNIKENIFNINSDSYLYLKQLLKTTIYVNNYPVRPYIILAECLDKLDYLTYDEFTYLIPLIISRKGCDQIINDIKSYRKNEIEIEDIIYRRLLSINNYKQARQKFLQSEVTEKLILSIGMNRKSKRYDKPYYNLYIALWNVYIDGNSKSVDLLKLLAAIKQLRPKTRSLWRNLLFRSTNISSIRKESKNCLNDNCAFKKCKNSNDFKETYFKYLHIFKAKSTLSDYFDLNRRYFTISDTIIFEDQRVKFDIVPMYYFKEVMHELSNEAFISCDVLEENVSLSDISNCLTLSNKEFSNILKNRLGVAENSSRQIAELIENNRIQRFNQLINTRFSDSVLLKLLDCFEKRDDKMIEQLVTEDATIPTIFEYILGIIWYKVSERSGDILKFMKLSLEANLLPKTHASGGAADIIYEYDSCPDYPSHSLLLEATLSAKNNQRKMEMEPVSRHLGDYRAKSNNPFDYSVFVTTYLDANVFSDFRFRKIMPYKKEDKLIEGMKIIPIDTHSLKLILQNGIKYKYLYKILDKYHDAPLDITMPLNNERQYENMLEEFTHL